MRAFSRTHTASVLLTALALGPSPLRAQPTATKPAEPAVRDAQAALRTQLPFADRQDFDDVQRGFIATLPGARDPQWYGFIDQGDAPDTVNPSLWRLAQLNKVHGLFQVVPGVYQVRGFALANVTLVEGQRGVIVIDPLGSVGAAQAAMTLYFAHRPKRPVSAVIYTHSHSDHYGGARAVVDPAEVAAGRTIVVAPAGFMDAVIDESVVAGNAMGRRAAYQFGAPLPRGPRGTIDAGLGKIDGVGAPGRSLVAPTTSIVEPFETRTIDGVRIDFQLTPDTEAPAEMHLFLPAQRVLNLAENATRTLHNLLPLRGTVVRDAASWSRYLDQALERFGAGTEVLVAQHHWPVWGRERVTRAVQNQRDLYKFLHDQTVRLMNHGYAPEEIAEALVLPPGLASDWGARGYYGTVSHDAKAIYQRYIGWYDGHPATLNPWPEPIAARRYVEYFGGTAAAIAKARADFAKGDYRWVAEVMRHVVFAEPENAEARALAADAFEQLGYAAESATWRNAYLLGAQELRQGAPPRRAAVLDLEMVQAMPLASVFDVLATHLDGLAAATRDVVTRWTMSDTKESLVVTIRNGALTHGRGVTPPTATVTTTRTTFDAIATGRLALAAAVTASQARVDGAAADAARLFEVLDTFDSNFAIVEPRRPRP